jgi:hypothetical protein
MLPRPMTLPNRGFDVSRTDKIRRHAEYDEYQIERPSGTDCPRSSIGRYRSRSACRRHNYAFRRRPLPIDQPIFT